MKDFFISYTKPDRDWAEWIAWILENAGYSVVIQAWDFMGGGNFVLEMQKAIQETQKTIAVLSNEYLESNFTAPEWAAAFASDPKGQGRKLIPVQVKPCKPSGLLACVIYVDLVGLLEEQAQARLLNQLKARGKPVSSPIFPGCISEKPPDAHVDARRVIFPGGLGISDDFSKVPFGRLTTLNCDRVHQEQKFQIAFHGNLSAGTGYPQVYLIHGAERERHESLVERFRETSIQNYADHVYETMNRAELKSKLQPIWNWKDMSQNWPVAGDLEVQKKWIIGLLLESCERSASYKYEHTVDSFRKLIPSEFPVIIVQHDLIIEKWDATNSSLILEYLKFWDDVKAVNSDKRFPQFVVFLNVIYSVAPDTSGRGIGDRVRKWRQQRDHGRIKEALKKFQELPDHVSAGKAAIQRSVLTVLDELPCVKFSHIKNWFRQNGIGENDAEWERQSKEIYVAMKWQLSQCRNMAEVEEALKQFLHNLRLKNAKRDSHDR